jgi:hypothetical protein
MRGQSRSKNGIASLGYAPRIHLPQKAVDGLPSQAWQ